MHVDNIQTSSLIGFPLEQDWYFNPIYPDYTKSRNNLVLLKYLKSLRRK